MGYTIVLTADRCLMSKYDPLCLGAAADFPLGTIPRFIMFRFVLPRIPEDSEGRALYAPYCLRKVETILLSRFDSREVIVVNPDSIHKYVDHDTKIVAVSTVDPLSMGPPVTTFCTLLKGTTGPITYISSEFEKLMKRLKRLKDKFNFKIVVGGPGAWELKNENLLNRYSIDHLIIGEAEGGLAEVFERLVKGERLPRIITMKYSTEFRPIVRPSIDGLIEVTRGCGRGCKFCSPTTRPFRSVPLEVIVKEAKVNLRYWKTLHLVTEDFLRYGSSTFNVNKNAVLKLVYTLRMLGTDNISPLHTTFATVVQAPDIIREISEVFEVNISSGKYIGTQIGLETASTRLIEKYMAGKARPFDPSKWVDIVEEACNILHENQWVVVSTLILGLPDETDDDIYKTIELMDRLKDFNIVWVPCIFTPLEITPLAGSKMITRDSMRQSHWELIAECCKQNIKIIDRFVNNYFKISNMNIVKRYLYSRAFNLMRRVFEEFYREVKSGDIPPPIITNFLGKIHKII